MNFQNTAFLLVAVLVVGFLGAYVLLYPNSPQSYIALGTLTTIGGGVGTALFHSSSQSFLGTQLAAQRTLTVAAMTQSGPPSGTPSTASTTSPAPPSTIGTADPTTPAPELLRFWSF